MRLSDVRLRDPFILPVKSEGTYYLYGTTDPDPWNGKGIGFDVYASTNLCEWTGPRPAFRPDAGFWADRDFWAPDVHGYRGGWFMLANFKSEGKRRATQVLKALSPRGAFRLHSPQPVTPREWDCLDGTLYVDRGGAP
jgi:arabinan endo-1,5-alpha-L-arabinosidase